MTDYNFSVPSSDSDRVLIVQGEKFHVNSSILSEQSEYFNALFNGEFMEKNQNEIEIKEVNADEFRNFLMFIHPTEMKITKDNYVELTSLCSRFLATESLAACCSFMIENCEKLQFSPMTELALRFNLLDVKEKLEEMFAANKHNKQIVIRCEFSASGCGRCENCVSNDKNVCAMKNQSVEGKRFIYEALGYKAMMKSLNWWPK